MRRKFATIWIAILTGPLVPTVAHAYVDPGTGSYYVQLIAAGIGGAVLMLRQLWHRFRGGMHRTERLPERDLDSDAEGNETSAGKK